MMEFKSIEEYVKYMRDNGYTAKDGTPLKCHHCESKNLERRNEYYCSYGVEEYEVWCKDCNKLVGRWSYGTWEL
jgi:hypothetical protein